MCSFIWMSILYIRNVHMYIHTYTSHATRLYSNYDNTRELKYICTCLHSGVSAVHSTSTYLYNCCPLCQLHVCVTCSTLDNICLPDLDNCMGIFVVCQLQLNSITVFLTHTVIIRSGRYTFLQ